MSGVSEVVAWVGVGANLPAEIQGHHFEPLDTLRTVRLALDEMEGVLVAASSPVVRSPPMGPADQPDYLNAVLLLRTSLQAEALLDVLQQLEDDFGRVRREHWGPRTLDLDLLLYGVQHMATERLTVPHPGLVERAFVLQPLCAMAERLQLKLKIPGMGPLQSHCGRYAPLPVIADDLES
jgi:2-amino-4-hydroxy-6-hydroxymethyldihydropteridine diphosphokinase